MTTTNLIARPIPGVRPMDLTTTLTHVGRSTILATSGGRYSMESNPDADLDDPNILALNLPVHYGYSVRVTLAADDTYTVERLYGKAGKLWEKGIWTGVYAEDLAETVYQAGLRPAR